MSKPRPTVSIPGFPEMYYDGITELWFSDEESIVKVLAQMNT
ncbi:hypothetical protein ACFOG5_24470 [Pedobacter fastidiosus]